MADVSSTSTKPLIAQQESDYKKQVLENRKVKEGHMNEVAETKNRNESQVELMRKDYNVKLSQEKNDLEMKLNEVRERYSERILKENERFESELSDLKRAHTDQVAELKTTQVKDIERMQKSQREYMENAKNKFESEKAKSRA